MARAASRNPTTLRLEPFDERFASVVAGWIETGEQLRLLAPGTTPPLTPTKVLGWRKPAGTRIMLARDGAEAPIAYAELNPMRRDPDHLWLGHVIVDPALRGRGLGRSFVEAILSHAFDRLCVARVSLIVFPENTVAQRCYVRAGFASVGEEHHRFNDADPKYRLLRMEAARSEWRRPADV